MGWYDSNWLYRQKITIDNTKVAGDLTDFPVAIQIDSANDVFNKALASGNDILFTASNGTTKLKHELSVYDNATPLLIAFVKTNLSGSNDTIIYMYYGYSKADDQSDKNNVWDTNFKGVWHLEEDPSGGAECILDSTSNGYTGTPEGSMTSGDLITAKIGKGIDFE